MSEILCCHKAKLPIEPASSERFQSVSCDIILQHWTNNTRRIVLSNANKATQFSVEFLLACHCDIVCFWLSGAADAILRGASFNRSSRVPF